MNWGKNPSNILGLSPYGLGQTNLPTSKEQLMNDTTLFPRELKKKGTNGYNAGKTCAALLIMDGWKIADDYPW